MTTHKFQQACLITLEVVVLLFCLLTFVDLSALDLWQAWLGMMFFWLTLLLLVASVKMHSKHRLLARIGIGLVTVIVLAALIAGLSGGLKKY